MKNRKFAYVLAAIIFTLGVASTYNWFPRPGWKTATAKYTTSPEVEYYTGSETVRGKLSGGGPACSIRRRQSCSSITLKIQYDPDKPHIVRMAPTAKPILMSVLLTSAGVGLYYFIRKK